jgi:hypothetical protein
VNWAAIAACESGGNWSTNTGNELRPVITTGTDVMDKKFI